MPQHDHDGPHPGRPPYQPTEAARNTVKNMAACGFSQESIARCIDRGDGEGIHPDTLRTHFRRELETSADLANARVGSVIYQQAIEGQGWACCFWAKTRMGWRETLQLAGEDGGPVKLTVEYVVEPPKSIA